MEAVTEDYKMKIITTTIIISVQILTNARRMS